MNRSVGETVAIQQVYARTSIRVDKRSFLCTIKSFSNLVPYQKQAYIIQNSSNEVMIQLNVSLSGEPDGEEKMYVDIFFSDQSLKFSTIKIFIIGLEKEKINAGEYECWSNYTKFPLRFTKKQLMDKLDLYAPYDTMTLNFELTISSGFAFHGVEKVACEYTSCKERDGKIKNWLQYINEEKIPNYPFALIADLTLLYKDQSACDMKLKTQTNTFPVHTLILSARSPVFKAMFSSEMKETVNGCVDVSDLQDETVHQFLWYLYTGQLEDLKWESALQLYSTADKYAVLALKEKCSLFLKSNLNLENATDALILSDLHQDKDLKFAVQNFILINAGMIFKSEEWKLLGNTNSKLVIETMLRNWTEN